MLHALLLKTAQTYPDRTALVYNDQRMSYRQLFEASAGLSRGLTALVSKQPACIALMLPNCVEFVVSFFATAFSHSIVLPINPLLKREEVEHYLRDCGVDLVITDAQSAAMCAAIIADMPHAVPLVVTDGEFPSAHRFAELCQTDGLSRAPAAVYNGDVLYQYSSGSTGRPKRVHRTQANLFHEAAHMTAAANVTAEDVILCMVPLFHAHGLGNCLLAAAISGATMVILEQHVEQGVAVTLPFAARCPRVLQLVADEHVSIMPGVPYIFSALAETQIDLPLRLESVRLCFSAGNFLPQKTFDAFLKRFGIPIRQLYGCTEAGSVTLNLDSDALRTSLSVGLPLGNVEIKIVDEQRHELPREQIGEIIFRSPALTSGYFNLPQLNEQAFCDGYFFTGDLGKLDHSGRLYVTGRKKIFIDTGGYKVDPFEIEDVLHTHERVEEAVVVGVDDTFGGEIIKAFVVPAADCTEHELLEYCRAKLSDFKVPRAVAFIDAIPKSPLGKILRKDLVQMHDRSQAEAQRGAAIRHLLRDEPSREKRARLLEQHTQELLRKTLSLDAQPIDRNKPFNELGLSSVTAVELVAQLAHTLDTRLSATLIWNYSTIAALALYLADSTAPLRAAGTAGETRIAQDLLIDVDEASLDDLSDAEVRQMLADTTDLILQDTDALSNL